MVQGGLFLLALAWFFLIRRTLSEMITDLQPVLRSFVDTTINSERRIVRDRGHLTMIVRVFTIGFPSGVIFLTIYFTQVLAIGWDTTSSLYRGIMAAFGGFLVVSFMLAAQLSLLFAVARLYTFRMRFLFSAMLQDDQTTLLAELDECTPSSDRKLLAVAPAFKQQAAPSYTEVPFTVPQAAPDGAATSTLINQKRLDTFLSVYRSIREEAAKHAKSWETPIILFLVAYFFVFVLTVVTLIREMIVSGVGTLRLEVIYVFLALIYIVLNLAPVRVFEWRS